MYRKSEVDQLSQRITEVMVRVKANQRYLPGFKPTEIEAVNRVLAGVDCDEVYDNVFIGDACAALNRTYLKKVGITHVVNAAEGNSIGMVNTSAKYYEGTGILYMGVKLMDLSVANISLHFQNVADFIEEAIENGGKVLVHCYMGVSRSGAFVIAYLMIKLGMSARNAMALIRQRRNIHPNDGFIRQLAALEYRLTRVPVSSFPSNS